MATYPVKRTCSLAGFLRLTLSFSSSLAEGCRLKEVSDMACPFLEEPLDIEAQNLHRERVFRHHLDGTFFDSQPSYDSYDTLWTSSQFWIIFLCCSSFFRQQEFSI